MSGTPELLEEAHRLGVELSATPEGKIRWRSRLPLPDSLRERLAVHKLDLLHLLRGCTVCPHCRGALDDKQRCWQCFDRRCRCGRMTGSAFISLCLQCEGESS